MVGDFDAEGPGDYRLASEPAGNMAARLLARQLARRIGGAEPAWQPPAPRPPYLGGIVEFLLYPSSLLCLMLLSLTAGLAAWIFLLLQIDQLPAALMLGPLERLYAMSILPGLLVLLPLLAAPAAAYWLAVVCETAYGYDQIHHWPGLDLRAWIHALLHVAWAALVATSIGLPPWWLMHDAPIWGAPVAVLLLFPVVLLSVLESHRPWIPFSLRVLHSLVQAWWAWLAFYLGSTVAIVLWLLAIQGAIERGSAWLLIVAAGPGLAAVSIVYARALGRLTWYLGEHARREAASAELTSGGVRA